MINRPAAAVVVFISFPLPEPVLWRGDPRFPLPLLEKKKVAKGTAGHLDDRGKTQGYPGAHRLSLREVLLRSTGLHRLPDLG